MQKFLLTCFLALLCLAGRYFTASSKVADSPTEVPLHRSASVVSPHSGDTHRGGAILSDTFHRIDFGLVDSDQDMGAGKGTSSLQPAPPESFRDPVTVSPHSRGQSTVDSRPNPPSPPNLLDSIPESHNQAVLYIELDGGSADASFQTHLWSRIGAQRFAIESSKTIINEVSPRDFYRGMLPTSSGALDIQTGKLTNPTYLGVSSGETMVLQPFLVFPGDSVLIRLNQQKGTIQFTGPAKKYFLVQQLLRLALENEGFTVHQILSVSNKTKYLDRNGNRQKIEEAKDKFGRSVKVLQQGGEELNWLIEQFEKSDFSPRVRRLVKAHQEIISEDKLEKLQSDVLGSYYATYAKQLKRIIPDLSAEAVPQANHFLSELQRSLEAIQQDNWGLSGIVEFWLTLADAQMEIQSLDPLAWISGLPTGYPRDLLVEHYFLSKGESLKNLDEQLEVGLSMVDDAGVLATLSQIKATRSLGTPVLPIALLTPENDTVDLASYKDQVLLVEFWLSGCGACLTRYQRVIKPLEEHFAKDSRFRMVAVSVDRNPDRWRSNIGTYSSEQSTNALALPSAFTGLRQYGIDSYPAFLLLGKNGQILRVSGFPNQLDQLINLIQHSLDTEFSTQPSTQQEK